VDLVCFSGDKLMGGPQAGIIVGASKYVAALKREPMFRALRCDKLILAALEATVDIYLREKVSGLDEIPTIFMLRIPEDELRARAEAIVSALKCVPISISISASRTQVGGGALPQSVLPSVSIDLVHMALQPQEIAARLRGHSTPIIGYIAQN